MSYIVFDIGGTTIKYALAHDHTRAAFEFVKEKDTNAKKIGGPGIVKVVKEIVSELMLTYKIDAISISTAGVVDPEKGMIVYANENIPNYTGINLKEEMETTFQIPTFIENDVNAALLGECVYASQQPIKNAFMLTVGTGIGGAVLMNGEVYHGTTFRAGEIGYMLVDDNSTLEAKASTTALVNNVELHSKISNLNGKKIFEMAADKNEAALQGIHEMCKYLAKGIANCIFLFNPNVIILGGGVMEQKEVLEPIIKSYLKVYLHDNMINEIELRFALLGNKAGISGALARIA